MYEKNFYICKINFTINQINFTYENKEKSL